MTPEPLLDWSDPLNELLGFAAAFLLTGAIGFRFAALGSLLGSSSVDERGYARAAAARAALFGLLGAVIASARTITGLPAAAARQHLEIGAYLAATPVAQIQIALIAFALAGFTLAATGRGAGWFVAGTGVLLLPLRGLVTGQWQRIVNPMHEYAAGYWIGTLFLLVALGIAHRGALAPERHAAVVARMVGGFSRLALVSFAVLGSFGLTTAILHLKRFDALWTTPYGKTFLVKMALVIGVLALGVWNWRRQKPRLGSASGTGSLRRSARAELAVAGAVLLVTAVLVSLPSPK